MTWTKLSDDFPDDCWTLSDPAFRLHTETLVWSNRKLLDCRIPRDDVRRFSRNGELAVAELLACGWWQQEGDVYVVLHHAGYQRTREEVVRRQAASAANGRRGGRPPKPAREIEPGGNLVANPAANLDGQDRTGQGSVAVVVPLDHEDQLDNFGRAPESDIPSRRGWCNRCADYRDACQHRLVPAGA